MYREQKPDDSIVGTKSEAVQPGVQDCHVAEQIIKDGNVVLTHLEELGVTGCSTKKEPTAQPVTSFDSEKCDDAMVSSDSTSADMEIQKSWEELNRSSISLLLRKFISESVDRKCKMINIDTELQKISQSNLQAFCKVSSHPSSACRFKRLNIDSKPSSEAEELRESTQQDLVELSKQIDKLSSLVKSRKSPPEMKSNASETESESAEVLAKDTQHLQSQDSRNNLSSDSNINTIPERDKEEDDSDHLPPETVDEQNAISKIDSHESEQEIKGNVKLKPHLRKRKKARKRENKVGEMKEPTRSDKRVKPKVLTPLCVQMLRDKYFSSKACAQIESFVTCNVCHKVFDNVSFEDHVKTQHAHKTPKLHPCVVCQQTFRLRAQLRQHMRTHPEFRPYKCSECSKSYTTDYSLRKHMLYHSGQRPHMCSICGNTFWHATHLKVHTMIHTGEAPFKCPDCPRRFKTAGTMRKHRVVHSNERPNLCSECGKTFKLIQGLRQHIKKVHKNYQTNALEMGQPKTEEVIHEAYNHFQTNTPSQQIEPPPRIDNTVTNTYGCGINSHRDVPKIEEPIHPSYLDQNFMRFPDMSNRTTNFFMPPDQSSAIPFHNQQIINRETINLFDKWE